MKQLFFFHKKQLKYVRIPLWLQFLIGGFFVFFIAILVLASLFYLTLPYISTPQSKLKEKQIQELTQIEDTLRKRIQNIEANLHQVMLFEKRIRERVLNDTLSQETDIMESDTVTSFEALFSQFQRLHHRVTSQGARLQEIQQYVSQNPSLTLFIPFSAPLESMNWGCGYGEKEHPVTHQTHFHQGIDFLCPEGTPILATARGKVVFAGVKPAYGKVVIIQHVENIQTLYAHLQSITVRNGQNVEKNTIIGYSGTTGIVLSPSLHYEIRIHEKPVNPFYYLQVLLNEEQKEEAQKQLTQCHVSLD